MGLNKVKIQQKFQQYELEKVQKVPVAQQQHGMRTWLVLNCLSHSFIAEVTQATPQEMGGWKLFPNTSVLAGERLPRQNSRERQ